ncbi:S66 peptidase family protein [Granulicella paludicola]|uniref:S66 peptidase family protein n=1 Tax=Granulicella paludicola TaxID=474951 RepID=UPI0021E06912|nr:LD-carboxypeptidase [Granulicella paludicola]
MTPRLRRGSRVAVVSPASHAKRELVEAGVDRLRVFGYEPVLMPHALSRGPLYYAGTAAERVVDLHAAFADDTIDGILCTRGGWGSAELLPLLDRDLICLHPKVFVGYSDHTSLHAWFWNECALPTFYAPMVAADWSKPDGVDERTWRSALQGDDSWSVSKTDGVSILREGWAEGRLLGGCLSILCEALGTPWALKIEEPTILFLEDIGTKPYKWDRFLQHLIFAGALKNVRGIVLGDMSANIEPNEMALMEAACLHALRNFDGPITIGLNCGHVQRRNCSVPLGAWVTMNGTELTV